MRQITTYDKNDVITIDYAKSQKPFYTYNGKTASIIEGLSPIHFAEKLYSGVEEGSKRWWVLERRKHDYNKFHSRRNAKRVTKDVINNHELEWTEKVANFYTLLHRGYLVKEVIKADGKIPSAYIIKKHFDGDNILSDEQAKKIGYDKNGRPLFFTVYRDAEGNDVDVECNVDLENIKYSGGNDCRRESLRWWIIERMRFDYGNKDRPLIEGQDMGDWRGVVRRFRYDNNGYIRLENVKDIIKLQQEAWERYIDARRRYLSTPHMTNEDIRAYNVFHISMMSEDDLIMMCREAPDILYEYIPSYLYGKIICDCIKRARYENRLDKKDTKRIKVLKNIITHIRGKADEVSADNISIDIVNKCLDLNPNDYKTIIIKLVLQTIVKGLVDKKFQTTLLNVAKSISIKSVNTGAKNKAFDMFRWLSVYDNSIHDAIYHRENQMKAFCAKYGLQVK